MRISDWSSDECSSDLDTAASTDEGKVRISNIRIVAGRFPALSPSDSDRLLNALRARMTKEDVIVSLERITAYLERAETALRWEERRVGKEGDVTCSSRW